MIAQPDEYWLSILRHNNGFTNPDKWIDYARTHSFTRVRSTTLSECPYCQGAAYRLLGYYIYYSTLISLRECRSCHLVFSDTHLDPSVVTGHFESAYKDEFYFSQRRRAVFEFAARLISRAAPASGSVLDIGGAQGHCLALVQELRPDLGLTLNDLSAKACATAGSQFGLSTVCSSIPDLAAHPRQYDVIAMLDVLYYEPDIRGVWQVVRRLLKNGGTLILRLPNKLGMIKTIQRVRLVAAPRRQTARRYSVPLFNPEHVYVFSKRHLARALADNGFGAIEFLHSPLLRRGSRIDVLLAALGGGAGLVSRVSAGRIVLTPSIFVQATSH